MWKIPRQDSHLLGKSSSTHQLLNYGNASILVAKRLLSQVLLHWSSWPLSPQENPDLATFQQ